MDTRTRIVEFVRHSPGASRGEIAEALGLPRTTVTGAVAQLLRSGELVAMDAEGGRPLRGRGRHPLRVVGDTPALGLVRWRTGTVRAEIVTRAGMLDHAGTVLADHSLPAPDPATGADGLDPIVDALLGMAADLPHHCLTGVVISAPAPFLRGTGTPAEHSRSNGLPQGFRLTEPGDLDAHFSQRHGVEFRTENNANLAALGELHASPDHQSRAPEDFVYVKLSNDGLGSAVVVNHRLVRGRRGFAGEIAHLQLDPHGPLCHCGGRGCLWLRMLDLVTGRVAPPQTASATQGRQAFDVERVARLAEQGDAGAVRILTDVGRLLGAPLGHLSTALDPDCIIVDTSIGPAVEHVLAGCREALSVYSPPAIAHHLEVRPSALGARAELLGALELPREETRGKR
ncbi:ROK family protein [Aestuariimicrobium soli]|uniref:ROK family protein n=1 Tax=Aestuariimicrobium soli TaxID=2035834 RepID=UPI003EBB9D8C